MSPWGHPGLWRWSLNRHLHKEVNLRKASESHQAEEGTCVKEEVAANNGDSLHVDYISNYIEDNRSLVSCCWKRKLKYGNLETRLNVWY